MVSKNETLAIINAKTDYHAQPDFLREDLKKN